MMDPRECQRDLARVLTETRQCGEALLDCLSREHEALRTGINDDLDQAIQDKVSQLQNLDNLEKSRVKLVGNAGYGPDRTSMEACINWCDPDSRLHALWSDMLKVIHACQANNRANGHAVEISRRHVRRALEILRGQPEDVELYQSGGNTNPTLAGRSLGKA